MASRFAISVLRNAGGDAYEKANDALMTMRAQVSLDSLQAIAVDLGVDAEAVMTGMNDPEVSRIIDENRALAQRMQINGTPSFVFETEMVRGYVPLDGMLQIVDGLRSEG